jgi:hypothetical protein
LAPGELFSGDGATRVVHNPVLPGLVGLYGFLPSPPALPGGWWRGAQWPARAPPRACLLSHRLVLATGILATPRWCDFTGRGFARRPPSALAVTSVAACRPSAPVVALLAARCYPRALAAASAAARCASALVAAPAAPVRSSALAAAPAAARCASSGAPATVGALPRAFRPLRFPSCWGIRRATPLPNQSTSVFQVGLAAARPSAAAELRFGGEWRPGLSAASAAVCSSSALAAALAAACCSSALAAASAAARCAPGALAAASAAACVGRFSGFGRCLRGRGSSPPLAFFGRRRLTRSWALVPALAALRRLSLTKAERPSMAARAAVSALVPLAATLHGGFGGCWVRASCGFASPALLAARPACLASPTGPLAAPALWWRSVGSGGASFFVSGPLGGPGRFGGDSSSAAPLPVVRAVDSAFATGGGGFFLGQLF